MLAKGEGGVFDFAVSAAVAVSVYVYRVYHSPETTGFSFVCLFALPISFCAKSKVEVKYMLVEQMCGARTRPWTWWALNLKLI